MSKSKLLAHVDRNIKTNLLIQNVHTEIQRELATVGWSGEPPGLSGQFFLVFCPSTDVYVPVVQVAVHGSSRVLKLPA